MVEVPKALMVDRDSHQLIRTSILVDASVLLDAGLPIPKSSANTKQRGSSASASALISGSRSHDLVTFFCVDHLEGCQDGGDEQEDGDVEDAAGSLEAIRFVGGLWVFVPRGAHMMEHQSLCIVSSVLAPVCSTMFPPGTAFAFSRNKRIVPVPASEASKAIARLVSKLEITTMAEFTCAVLDSTGCSEDACRTASATLGIHMSEREKREQEERNSNGGHERFDDKRNGEGGIDVDEEAGQFYREVDDVYVEGTMSLKKDQAGQPAPKTKTRARASKKPLGTNKGQESKGGVRRKRPRPGEGQGDDDDEGTSDPESEGWYPKSGDEGDEVEDDEEEHGLDIEDDDEGDGADADGMCNDAFDDAPPSEDDDDV